MGLSESLKADLSTNLPDYMVPSAYVILEQLPLTPNGKLDRKALPAPDMALQQKAYVAPTTETQKLLCEIWEEVLGVERVGITDNFFELGGHSLLATRLVALIQARLVIEVPLRELFSAPTVESLSAQLIDLPSGPVRPPIVQASREQDLPLSYAQQRLWLLDKIDGGSAHYNMPSALRLTGRLDVGALTQAFNTLLSRHEVLRTCFAADDTGEPIQLIRSATVLDIPLTDISSIPEDEREVALIALGIARVE